MLGYILSIKLKAFSKILYTLNVFKGLFDIWLLRFLPHENTNANSLINSLLASDHSVSCPLYAYTQVAVLPKPKLMQNFEQSPTMIHLTFSRVK